MVLHRADCVAACCFPLVAKSDYKVSHTLQQLIPVFTTIIHHSLNHAAPTVGDYTININEEIWEGNQAMFFIKKHTFLSLDHLTDGVHSTAVEETSKGNRKDQGQQENETSLATRTAIKTKQQQGVRVHQLLHGTPTIQNSYLKAKCIKNISVLAWVIIFKSNIRGINLIELQITYLHEGMYLIWI